MDAVVCFTGSIMRTTLVSLLLSVYFVSCSSFKLKSLYSLETQNRDCYKSEEQSLSDEIPEFESKLMRQGALRSKALFLCSDFGMHEKTARVFIVNQNKIFLIIHFFGGIDQIIKDYPFEIQFGDERIGLGRLKLENRNIIGEVFEEELSVELSKEIFEKTSKCNHLKLLINEISFEIPFECREEWRMLSKKINLNSNTGLDY